MKKVVATFEELIQHYYGGSPTIELRPLDRFEAVVANYYGKPFVKHKKRPNGACVPTIALSADDGELLSQPSSGKLKCEEYVVERSLGEPVFGDYIVDRSAQSTVGALAERVRTPDPDSASAECRVDVLQSQAEDTAPQGNAAACAPVFQSQAPPAQHAMSWWQPPSVGAESLPSARQKPASNTNQDDFAADLQSILSGQQVYDPRAKKMVPREQLGQESSASRTENPRPSLDATNHHEIFDQIAQRMKYANTFDLGTVELEKRFGEFDALRDLQGAAKDKKTSTAQTISPVSTTSLPEVKADTGDFIRDLDAIRSQHLAAARAVGLSTAPDPSQYSRPLFDTGEHVLVGPDLYDGRLRVGKDPGVQFSYGQIIAMADLYGSVDEMMSAESTSLQKVKTLIERSTEYYRTGKRNAQLDVTNKEWNDATGGRYLDLAEDNYEHFSPNFFFPNGSFAGSLNQHGNNKSQWEAYHKRALEEAQRALAAANPNTSVFLEYPLIVNAFGDHYLTDAFAAGHVINKEEMIAYFKANFFNGSSLKPEGDKFFEKLAKETFRGQVAKKFSALETADYPVCKWGWCLKWHPNINSVDRFKSMLTEAAEQQPDAVANFAVKALHDKLNKDGLEVVNDAGDGPWTITGDGYMNDKSRVIIRKAVQQSVDNINDPSIRASNLNFDLYFAQVWKYVPRLTDASKRRVVDLANDYLLPTSDRLVKAAAAIITRDVDTLIEKLIRENKLKPA